MAGPKVEVGTKKICSKKVYTSWVEIAEEAIEPQFLEKKICLLSAAFTSASNCYRK